jgi:zinc transporter
MMRLTPVCAFDVDPDGTARPTAALEPLPEGSRGYRWLHLNLDDPGFAEWVDSHLPPIVARSLKATETRPRVNAHGEGLILTLRGANLNAGSEVEDMVSVRIWATQTLLITVRRRKIFAMDDLRQEANEGHAAPTTAEFLSALCDGLTERIETVSLDLDEITETMETEVYDEEDESQPELAPLRRKVIKLRRHIGPQTDALNLLAVIDTPVIPASLRPRLHENANRATRSVEELHEVRERLSAISDHLDLVQTARMGRNGFALSVIAVIFLPLGFITGLFGVNLGGIPGSQSPLGFLLLCVALSALGVGLYILMRWRRWL